MIQRKHTTLSAVAIIGGGPCSILEPEIFHESFETFEETYRDHFPVFIDCIMQRYKSDFPSFVKSLSW